MLDTFSLVEHETHFNVPSAIVHRFPGSRFTSKCMSFFDKNYKSMKLARIMKSCKLPLTCQSKEWENKLLASDSHIKSPQYHDKRT